MQSNESFTGKSIVITGAGGGLGQILTRAFVERDAKVYCCLREQSNEFDDFLKLLPKQSINKVQTLYFDLTNESEIIAVANSLIKEKITIDVLINNAGAAAGSTVEMTRMADLRSIFEVNFFSQIFVIQKLLRLVKKSESGRIINIGSVAGLVGDRGTLAYGASKASLMYATKTMANEFAKYKISVNAIAPGVVSTGMSSQMDEGARESMTMENFFAAEVDPADVANLACFLASDKSKSINGQVLRIDNGMRY
ncbi:SDR family NAD(P)-dependent oxidoreductase [Alphaproteobacteria bacterium]|nr:SDR family NAD(P)-dependent oxidoreductase [Alphaproteobacteria bacterium]